MDGPSLPKANTGPSSPGRKRPHNADEDDSLEDYPSSSKRPRTSAPCEAASGQKRALDDGENDSLKDYSSSASERSRASAPHEAASSLKRALDDDPDDLHIQASKRPRTISPSGDASAESGIASSSKDKGKAVDRSNAEPSTPDEGKVHMVIPLSEDDEELEDYVDSESIRVMLDDISDASKESPDASKAPKALA